MKNNMPIYRHDCDHCKFLGVYLNADLYCCVDWMKPHDPTLVARFSSEPPDYSGSRISRLEYFNNNEFLKEAKKRAIKEGYLKELVKGEIEMCETTIVEPVVTIPDSKMYNLGDMVLTQYIKDKKTGRKTGMIQAFKINHHWFNNTCINSSFHKEKSFVIIVHSKVRPGCGDVFDINRGQEICYAKLDFVISILGGQRQRRKKYLEEMPIKDTLKYYKEIYERARRYYKDCDEIIQYHEVFDFVEDNSIEEFVEELDDKILSNYNRLKNLVLEQKDNNFIQITETFKPCKGEGNCSCKKE